MPEEMHYVCVWWLIILECWKSNGQMKKTVVSWWGGSFGSSMGEIQSLMVIIALGVQRVH